MKTMQPVNEVLHSEVKLNLTKLVGMCVILLIYNSALVLKLETVVTKTCFVDHFFQSLYE